MEFTAYVLDVLTDSAYPARIKIEDGIFREITPISVNSEIKLNVKGLLLPGFIDSHIHIESSMLTPAQFARIAVMHGTTSVVCDPHEIANVCGIDGIEFMIENARQVPFNFYFSAPSCVSATSFETSGAILDSEDIEFLLKKDEVVSLGEMMNFPGVIKGGGEVIRKFEWPDNTKNQLMVMCHYFQVKNWINTLNYITDPECSTFDEAIEKSRKV